MTVTLRAHADIAAAWRPAGAGRDTTRLTEHVTGYITAHLTEDSTGHVIGHPIRHVTGHPATAEPRAGSSRLSR